MFTKKDFSLPTKVIALVIAVILIGFTSFVIYTTNYGQVTITTSQKGVVVFKSGEEVSYPLPHTYRLRPGKYVFFVIASGYKDKVVEASVPAFRTRNVAVTLEKVADGGQSESLLNALPYGTTHFYVERPDSQGVYVVTLSATLNDIQDYSRYEKELNDYGKEALDWIRAKGGDPNKLTIQWIPEKPPAISVGKTYEK